MSLAPTATITLGNLRYTTQASAITVSLSLLPGVNRASVVLPSGVEISAAPGDPAIFELDGGEGAQTVLTGTVRSLHRGLLATRIETADRGADLASLRPASTYRQQSASAVIGALAGAVNLDVGSVDVDLDLAAYVAHQRRTGAEHVAELARLSGTLARVDGDGALQVRARPSGQPDTALLYGREIIHYEVAEREAGPARRIVLGSGPAGASAAPDALRPTLQPLPGDAPAPGPGARWEPAGMLRTPGAVATATQAAAAVAGASTSRVRARCFLLPQLAPGTVFEVQDLPNDLSGGPWLVTHVTHQLWPASGGVTTVVGESAEGGGDSLLGAILGAIGSLL